MAGDLATLFIILVLYVITAQKSLSQGEVRLKLGWNCNQRNLHILLEAVKMAFWLGSQKMVKASEEERFLMEVPLSLSKQKPHSNTVLVFM